MIEGNVPCACSGYLCVFLISLSFFFYFVGGRGWRSALAGKGGGGERGGGEGQLVEERKLVCS